MEYEAVPHEPMAHPMAHENGLAHKIRTAPEKLSQNIHQRPEGPTVASPERQLGVWIRTTASAEGAAQKRGEKCRTFGAPYPNHSIPDLTVGPSI
jgi:hypothetical protein